MQIDPQLPHLPTALQPLLMQKLLQRTLLSPLDNQGHGLVVDSCLIGEKRHKPGKSCVLSYRLQLRDGRTGASQEQVVSARLCKPEHGLEEFNRARTRELFPAPGLQPLAYLPETEMVLWSFPNDRKLTHLPQLLNLKFLAAHLPKKLLSLELDESDEIGAIETEILHYLPERSCMIRYCLAMKRSTGGSQALTLYGKNYRDEQGAEVYSIMRQLAGQMSGSAVPLGYDQDLRTLWQSHVPGKPFLWETLPASHTPDLLRNIARSVAEFHRCTLQTPGRFDLKDIDESLLDTVRVAEQACPDLAGRIRSLVNRLSAQRRSMGWPDSPATPIHRDLKMRNFLIDGERVGLIDMDCVCIGDPLSDIASLIANFHLNGIRASCDDAGIRKVVDLFRSAYVEAAAYAVFLPRLNWYTAAAFIHEITRRSIQQLDAERVTRIGEYLDLSERYASS